MLPYVEGMTVNVNAGREWFNRRDLAENLAKMGLHGAGKEDGGGSRGAKIGEKTLDYGGENRWVRIIGIKPR